jgi:uncharacterized damage-inducible protein DinB
MNDTGQRSAFALMALNNAYANETLIGACATLDDADYAAHRTSFFPSIRSTLNHIHAVDRYYIDALTRGGLGPHAFYDAPDFPSAAALRPAQAMLDQRLIRYCSDLVPGEERHSVTTNRGVKGLVEERVDLLLLHLFQHQIHHRGQVHAMLSGTGIKPPQLDEFFLAFDRNVANPDLVP